MQILHGFERQQKERQLSELDMKLREVTKAILVVARDVALNDGDRVAHIEHAIREWGTKAYCAGMARTEVRNVSEDGKVVYLKFRSEQLQDDTMAFLSCKTCKNKTFTHTFDQMDNFPLVRCAACSQHIGRVGYADTKDPASTG